MIKETDLTPFTTLIFLTGEALRWWNKLDKGTKHSPTWENFEKLFSIKWIKDTKKKDIYNIQEELKEEIKKKGGELSKI
jgi:hypothetical protein